MIWKYFFSSGQEAKFELKKYEGVASNVVGHTAVSLSHTHSPFLLPNKKMIFLKYPCLLPLTQGRVSSLLLPRANKTLCTSQNSFWSRVGYVFNYVYQKKRLDSVLGAEDLSLSCSMSTRSHMALMVLMVTTREKQE